MTLANGYTVDKIRNLWGRIRGWSGQISEFALAQGFGQAAGMASGLIYVRYMPIDEYAIYALSLTSLSMVSLGSDLGLTGSLNYFWRHSEQDWDTMAPRIAAIRRLRFVLLILAALVCAVLFFKTAVAQKLTLASVLGLLLLVILTAAMQMRSVVDVQLLRLRGFQRKSYYPDFMASVFRLFAALAMIVTGITAAWFGLFGGLLGAIAAVGVVYLIVGDSHQVPAIVGRDTWREMRSYLLPTLPVVLVFIVQEPLVLWMAATYGSNVVVVEVFALGRIAAIFGLLGSVIIVVILPRLAQISDDERLKWVWFYILTVLVMISVITIALTLYWPAIPLLLIGPKYSHLTSEVVISIGTASVTMLIIFVAHANRVRGWVRLEPVVGMSQLVAILTCVKIWSFESSANVLLLSLTLAVISFASVLAVSLIGLIRPSIVKLS